MIYLKKIQYLFFITLPISTMKQTTHECSAYLIIKIAEKIDSLYNCDLYFNGKFIVIDVR